MDERSSRVARNESAFRQINEGIRAGGPRDPHATIGFVCECGDGTCTRIVDLTVDEYEQVRADGRHFVVFRGHEIPEAEDVVETRGRHLVVRKHGDAGAAVGATDPRR